MSQIFKPGDLVRLKSGSSLMTVESVELPGYAKVVWFIGSEYQTATIANEALEQGQKER